MPRNIYVIGNSSGYMDDNMHDDFASKPSALMIPNKYTEQIYFFSEQNGNGNGSAK